ncbi:hypothetical protein ACPOL_4428 [Acidisarcina polymorpha]|uniref:Uncharacterized protein n=1 Tax=Acidisarcina polymorpha TaxID=2211140 RepID=A0A2Z5G3J0_9BACT|nr:hypothetical protein [Acidisarcina polymorpha]AXC13701.1 hypothetical protein ACPOL_4428 [Acidisarcina polymorpha]
MPKLTLFAYQTGEQYITKAALIADRSMEVEISPGTESMYAMYEEAAAARKMSTLDLFASRFNRQFGSEAEVKTHLRPILQNQAAQMANFLQSGIPTNHYKRDRVSVVADTERGGKVRGSTDAAVAPFLEDPVRAQRRLHAAIAASVPESRSRGELRDFYLKQGFSQDEKYVLLWGRSSGRTNAAGPHLDTNPTMLAQMMVSIREMEPDRKLVLIGDPVNIPGAVGGTSVPHADMNLFQYWRSKDWPGGKDMASQMFFLALIQSHHPETVSVGTNSGILELPHLMGMRTIYLENKHDHDRKGLRWQKKLEMTNIDRLSTTAATELWGRKNVLFEEVREWLGSRMPGAYPSEEQAAFLSQLKELASLDEGTKQPGQTRPFAQKLADVSSSWARSRSEHFTGSNSTSGAALAKMNDSLLKDKLTRDELDRFRKIWQEGLDRETSGRSQEAWRSVLVDQQQEGTPIAADETDFNPPVNVARPRSPSSTMPGAFPEGS